MTFIAGKSGNPKGRPRADINAATIRKAIGHEADAIVSAVINAAKGGDMAAAKILLDRICPQLKPGSEPITVKLSGDTLTERATSVLDAVRHGALAPGDARELLHALTSVARICEFDDLRRRVEALETGVIIDQTTNITRIARKKSHEPAT
ncbi:MAG: DUF5681 domain-containing protein [Methylococcales bacterium]